MQHQSLWSRLTEWFTTDPEDKINPPPTPQQRTTGLNDDLQITKPRPENGASNVTRIPSRTQAIEKLEQGYEKLIGLVDNLNSHLENQQKGTERIVTAVNELSHSVNNLTRLPEQLDEHKKAINAIADRLNALDKLNDRMGTLDTISDSWKTTAEQLPKIADAHRESLNVVRQQVESSNAVQQQVADSMSTLEQTVSTVGNASTTATETIREHQVASAKRDHDLINVLQDQNKKFTALMLVGIAVTIVMAAGILIIALSK